MMNSILDDFKNAWDKPNNSPAQLIIINVVVFLLLGLLNVIATLSGAQSIFQVVYDQFSIPPIITDFITRPWTIITYSFAHSLSDIFHILFNMLVFYWFSKIILEFLGNNRVISLYVLGALAGAIVYLLMYNLIPFYVDRAPGVGGMVGASAAVYAVVVGAAVFMPDYTMYLLFLGPVKIKYIAAFYVVLSIFGIVGGNAGGNLAHLGGALAGWLYVSQLRSGTDLGAWVISFIQWVKSFFVASPKIKVTHRGGSTKQKKKAASSTSTDIDQDEIDNILDKISQSGYESLTKDEKQKLFNASKK